MGKSTGKPRAVKPSKPHPDFPLWLHPSGRWCKKVRGRAYYFGKADDPQGALERWLEVKDDLLAGRTPKTKPGALVIRELLNRFLTAKRHLVDTGEITLRTWADYHATCQHMADVFGRDRLVEDLATGDFEQLRRALSKTRGPVALGNEINRTRILFKYAWDEGLIEKPVRYGQSFKRPSQRALRKARNGREPRMFEAHEIRSMIGAAGPQLQAMILLGVNCGLGNSDIGNLPTKALDLEAGWLDYPRPKTAVDRRCPLWPETVAAVREALRGRPRPQDRADAGLVFLTRRGRQWAKPTRANPISRECRNLLERIGLYRPGCGFYALRHVTETIGGEARDQVALNYIMGHSPRPGDMSAVYRERISDDRLQAVTDHVRRWLFEETDNT